MGVVTTTAAEAAMTAADASATLETIPEIRTAGVSAADASANAADADKTAIPKRKVGSATSG